MASVSVDDVRDVINARAKSGIEIKLSPDEGEPDRLYGQIDKYLDHLDTVIAVIFFERSRESTESFMRRLAKRGWLDNRVYVLSM